jgi:nitrogen fixation protein NifQ
MYAWAATTAADAAADAYRTLMSEAAGDGNDHVLACMIASWQAGEGSMPDWLGLSPAGFRCLLAFHFPHTDAKDFVPIGRKLPGERLDEIEDLVRLMLIDKAGRSTSEVWMARIVAAGCMAPDHLWHDLGLWSREDLSALMRRNFPPLAARNLKDMKWKRFLYKQLCEAEGIYSCRAPSCEICTDYHVCFGA